MEETRLRCENERLREQLAAMTKRAEEAERSARISLVGDLLKKPVEVKLKEAEAENALLREELVFARDFIMSGPRPGDEMIAVQRISSALED